MVGGGGCRGDVEVGSDVGIERHFNIDSSDAERLLHSESIEQGRVEEMHEVASPVISDPLPITNGNDMSHTGRYKFIGKRFTVAGQ